MTTTLDRPDLGSNDAPGAHGKAVLDDLSPLHRQLRRAIPDAYAGFGELHRAAFADGRATFLTTYVLGGDPSVAFDAMSVELPKLYEQGRMTFPAEKKVVREGDVFAGTAAVGDPVRQLNAADVPFVGHTGVLVVQRDHAAPGRAERLVAVDGVHGTWAMESRNRPGTHLEMTFVEGDVGAVARTVREQVPHDGDVLLDAPYELINPLHYPWADAIRASDLPKTVS